MPARTTDKQIKPRRRPAPKTQAQRQPAARLAAPGLQQAVDRPEAASPAAVVALQHHYGNRAVQRLVDQGETVQRFSGLLGGLGQSLSGLLSKKKPGKLSGQQAKTGQLTQPEAKVPETAPEPERSTPKPTTAKTLLVLKVMLAPPAETIEPTRLSEYLRGVTGHSWLELDLGPDFASLAALESTPEGATVTGALEASTETALESGGRTSLAFYPNADSVPIPTIFRGLFAGFPGGVREPESATFQSRGSAMAAYPVTDPARAVQVLRYVRAARKQRYSLVKYNSMDFVLGAVRAAGGPTPGRTPENPRELYKRIYRKMLSAARSGQLRELSLLAPEGESKPEDAEQAKVDERFVNIREGAYKVTFPAGIQVDVFPSEVRQTPTRHKFDADTPAVVRVLDRLKAAGRAKVELPGKVFFMRLERLFTRQGKLRPLRTPSEKARPDVTGPEEEGSLFGNLFD